MIIRSYRIKVSMQVMKSCYPYDNVKITMLRSKIIMGRFTMTMLINVTANKGFRKLSDTLLN